jgi:hypothetical protein
MPSIEMLLTCLPYKCRRFRRNFMHAFRRNFMHAFHTNVDAFRRNVMHAFHTNVDAFRRNFMHAFHTNVDAFRRNLKLMRAHSLVTMVTSVAILCKMAACKQCTHEFALPNCNFCPVRFHFCVFRKKSQVNPAMIVMFY